MSSYIVFDIIPPVLNENKHETSKQNVPMKKEHAIVKKNKSVFVGLYLQKSHATHTIHTAPKIFKIQISNDFSFKNA